MEFETFSTQSLHLRLLTPERLTECFRTMREPELRALIGDADFEKFAPRMAGGLSSWDRSFRYFQLALKETGVIIGACGIHNWFMHHRRGEVGYVMAVEEYRNRGLMKEALGFVLEYGFQHLNLHRIEAYTRMDNTPSLRLLEHYGFTREGLLREHYCNEGVMEDSVLYALLRSEYDERRISK